MKLFRQDTNRDDASKDGAGASTQRIEAAIRRIPRGCVASYGQVAQVAGLPGRARLVARVLRLSEQDLPWHRVLRSDGSSAFAAGSEARRTQCELLRAEGVHMNGHRADLRSARWEPLAELMARELLGLGEDD